MSNLSSTKVITGVARFSYANLISPRVPQSGGDPKYSTTLLIGQGRRLCRGAGGTRMARSSEVRWQQLQQIVAVAVQAAEQMGAAGLLPEDLPRKLDYAMARAKEALARRESPLTRIQCAQP